MSNTINFSSNVKFEGFSDELLQRFKSAAIAGLLEASGEIEAEVKRNTHVDTGQLKGSWKHVVDENKLEAQIGSPLENAIWEEFGTGEYALNGDGRTTPWSYKDAKGNTHGKRPNRALFNAFNTKKAKIQSMMSKKFKERMK